MKNLLKADYSRLFKHKFIYVSIGFIILSVIFSWVLQFMNCKLLITERNAAAESGIEDHFDESIFLNLISFSSITLRALLRMSLPQR